MTATGFMECLMQGFETGPDFRITRVWAKNFRSIADVSFDLEPLTILVGPNASGKSNLLDILRFVKDALRDLEVAVSRRQGMDGVARHEAGGGDSDVEVGVAAVVRDANGKHDNYSSVEYEFTLAGMVNGNYRLRKEHWKFRERDDSAVTEFKIEDGKLVSPDISNEGSRYSFPYYDIDFYTDNLVLPAFARLSTQLFHDGGFRTRRDLLHNGLREFHRKLTNMRFYHIFPNTIREPQRLSNVSILEEDADNLASIIEGFDRMESGSMARLREDVGLLIPGVSDIRVEPVGGYLVVKLKRDAIGEDPWLDLSMESDGTIRLLGLVVALYQQPYLPVIGIEEPELTAHPDALAVLADLINEAARRSQVIVTTHSPDLIDFLTDYRTVENLRVVELDGGVTKVQRVPDNQAEAVRKHLYSPGELHRTGELMVSW